MFLTRVLLVFFACTLAIGLAGQQFVAVSETILPKTAAQDEKLMAGGVVWFDYNGDRYPDLLLTNGTSSTRLYRNDWDGSFTDVSERSGMLGIVNTMGGLSGDFDNDGDADLFLTTLAGYPNILLQNNGTGGFVNIAVAAGITHTAYGASATSGDFDGDGDLDIYVANYLAGTEAREGGQPNFLYRNDGGMRFTEVAVAYGVADEGCGLGATFTDLNADGRQDLYVANDFGYLVQPNEYFRNEPAAFSRLAASSGSAAQINGMGIAKGDYDNDGDVDLYVTNIRENPLFENIDGGDFFRYQSFQAGVDLPELTSWGTSFTDFDLDGLLDLVVANGQIANQAGENFGEPLQYYHNTGERAFTDASAASGLANQVTMGRGLAAADYNLDGYPDLAVNAVRASSAGEDNALLLQNTAVNPSGHWLAIESPYDALSFRLYFGDQIRYRERDGGSSYLSHADVPVHFGYSSGKQIDSLVVSYTDGSQQTYRDLPQDRLVGILKSGDWYNIAHQRSFRCASEPAEPEIQSSWSVDESTGTERLLLERTDTEVYAQLDPLVVTLNAGDIYRGEARTQDAMFVDTIPVADSCPSLQSVEIQIRSATGAASHLFPNPVVGSELNVELPQGGGELTLTIYTVHGATILHHVFPLADDQQKVTIPVSWLPQGSYVCRLQHQGKTTHHKFLRS